MKTLREYIDILESFSVSQPLSEGVMDRLRRIYMGLVYDRPWGTPDSEFLSQWQREIKAQLGQDIDVDTLSKLQQNFRERGRTMMARGDWADYDREMGIREQGVAEGSSSQIKTYSGPPEGYTFSRVQQKNYDMLVDILARNGMKFTRIDAETYPGRRSYYDRIGKSTPIMLTSFIGRSPALEWYKYEGQTAGGGTNTVKVGGKKMKLTDFLRLKPEQQDALLKSSPGQGVAEGSDENFKSGDKVYHSSRKEIGTFLDYDDRNTTTNNNAWVDFDGEELMVSLDRLSKVQQGVAEAGPFSYGKAPRKGSVADLAAKKRREQEKGKQPIEPRDQRVGVARVTKGVAEGDQDLEETQQVEEDPVAQITRLHRELSRR